MTKSEIIALALSKLQRRIEEVQQQIVETEKSQAEDSKSSAGDKFETGRERLQQELDRLNAQLLYLQEQRLALEYAGRKESSVKSALGSLVTLRNGARYLVAVGYGKLKLNDGSQVFVVSPEAPIGQVLLNKVAGESFDFRNNTFHIQTIE